MAATGIYPSNKTENFIEKAQKIHDNKYDYSLVEYKNNKTKITIICPNHGKFEQTPNHHLKRQGYPKCYNESQRSNTEDFIKRAKEVHGNFYDYSLVDYKNVHTKVTIICTNHGEFEQRSNSHLNGAGCPKFYNENQKGILDKKFIKDNPEKAKENCTFYIIQLFNDKETFIKCGITQTTIQERFCRMKYYNYEIVDLFEITLEDAINLEYYFSENFERYRPKNKFGGYTECFHIKEKEKFIKHLIVDHDKMLGLRISSPVAASGRQPFLRTCQNRL